MLDLFVERATIGRDQAGTFHRQIECLPAVAGLLHLVIDGNGLRARLDDQRPDGDLVGAGRHGKRLDLDILVTVTGKRTGIGAYQHGAKLGNQLLALLGCGTAPAASDCQPRHALEVEMRQHLGIHQRQYLLLVAGLDILVLFDDLQDFLHGILDQHVWIGHVCISRHRRSGQQQTKHQNSYFFHDCPVNCT